MLMNRRPLTFSMERGASAAPLGPHDSQARLATRRSHVSEAFSWFILSGRFPLRLWRKTSEHAPMPPESPITAIAHVIQLAIAPVFLISGVATLLSVLTNRLGRVVDRARVVEAELKPDDTAQQNEICEELARLSTRARLINSAITFCTICALLTCITIATLFTGTFLSVNLSRLITVLFIAAMLSLFLALLSFLREVISSTRPLRIAWWRRVGGGTSTAGPPRVEE
jgi:hypothetical protein